jgi:uncharacterized protein GlcG (DUF336 family)
VIAAVVDAGVQLKAFTRMDRAVLASIDIALKKARTAALFQSNSEAVWEYCKPARLRLASRRSRRRCSRN